MDPLTAWVFGAEFTWEGLLLGLGIVGALIAIATKVWMAAGRINEAVNRLDMVPEHEAQIKVLQATSVATDRRLDVVEHKQDDMGRKLDELAVIFREHTAQDHENFGQIIDTLDRIEHNTEG